jgi:DNA-binding NarL/FixJ family response regulator
VAIEVLLVDDDAEVRRALSSLLARTEDIAVVAHGADGTEAVTLARKFRPDVVLMDIQMPDVDGIEATRLITRSSADTKVIMLTTFDLDDYLFASLRQGASGFLTKSASPETLREAIRVVASGHALLDPTVTRRVISRFAARDGHREAVESLTAREREVALLVARGLSNDEISAALTLSIWTVKTHVGRILAKLGARERAQIVIAMYESGLVRR